jgi:hypothetical protein
MSSYDVRGILGTKIVQDSSRSTDLPGGWDGTEQKTTMSARKLVTVVQDRTQCQNNECDLLS